MSRRFDRESIDAEKRWGDEGGGERETSAAASVRFGYLLGLKEAIRALGSFPHHKREGEPFFIHAPSFETLLKNMRKEAE